MTTMTLPATDRNDAINRLVTFLLAAIPGKPLDVTIKPKTKRRSSAQCRYLNGVAYKLLSESTGYERDDISEYLCGTYFGWTDKLKPGKKVVQVPIRTTTTNAEGNYAPLDTHDFAEYVEFVQRFGARHGVYIPNPTRLCHELRKASAIAQQEMAKGSSRN